MPQIALVKQVLFLHEWEVMKRVKEVKNCIINFNEVQNPRRCMRHDKIADIDTLCACSTKLIVGLGHATAWQFFWKAVVLAKTLHIFARA